MKMKYTSLESNTVRNYMFKWFFGSVFGIICFILLSVTTAWGGLQMYKWLAPEYAKVEREVFENTPSYVRGKQQRLTDLCLEYETAGSDHQPALRNVILLEQEGITEHEQEFDQFVRDCLSKMRNGG